MPNFLNLEDLRLPNQPETPLFLDGSPLQILSEESCSNTQEEKDPSNPITPAIGVATVLYNWTPTSLLALLDLESWFSITWTLTLPDSTKLEIGRIRNQVTMGRLDSEGLWSLMLTLNISPLEEEGGQNGTYQGRWIPNTEESMLNDKNITSPSEIENLATEFVKELMAEKRWLTSKSTRHEFFVESLNLGMDPWEDGLAMNPHWLYTALDLSKCTTCSLESKGQQGKALNRCGRCGTAAYCSAECQRKDWAVHKAVCALSAEDRGKALMYSRNGGLVNWVAEGDGVPDVEEGDEDAGDQDKDE